MGIKELWSILSPHAKCKPMNELRGKKVAIDLAGWVCESLNVVDYSVHPRHHLKNLFFRTCYLIWEQITPIFVLDGVAPTLKSRVMAKRNEIQFRGVRPKKNMSEAIKPKAAHARTRFSCVLKQCENLLTSMGIRCVQAPGEAEAFCAFLNKLGLVDGVISQDSDCFAYGATRVYRNFSVSTQGSQAGFGGSVDIYDMKDICTRIDFGQNKIIVMALLCGCDYCPDGIGGIGKDGVLKLFKKYKDSEILQRIRNWRSDVVFFNELELRVEDKGSCINCGHIGQTQIHKKKGCNVCGTQKGCDESLWRDQRLSIKAELMLRKKALCDANFPNEEIISEFLSDPTIIPDLNLDWRQPNLVKFIRQIGNLLQWPEIYCFQKFFPILTRWQLQNKSSLLVHPKSINKTRRVKAVVCVEVTWEDTGGNFQELIPAEQIADFEMEHSNCLEQLYLTIEPLELFQTAYPDMVATYIKSTEKPSKKPSQESLAAEAPENRDMLSRNLHKTVFVKKTKSLKKTRNKGQTTMNKFLKIKEDTLNKTMHCSTPIAKCLPSDLDSDSEWNMSDIVDRIVSNRNISPPFTNHGGRLLHFETVSKPVHLNLGQLSICGSDEMQKIKRSSKKVHCPDAMSLDKCYSEDDSFDLLVKDPKRHQSKKTQSPRRFMEQRPIDSEDRTNNNCRPDISANDMSYFFNQSSDKKDVFEEIMASMSVLEDAVKYTDNA